MLIGYARVSTDDQKLNLQMDALQQAGCAKIYSDRLSGVKAARPGLSQALEVARAGDVLVVWRLDRLGRSLKDLIEIMSKLDERGIQLSSLSESITTTNNSGRLIFHLFGALAEFERNLIPEQNDFTNRNTTFMTWNLLHMARMIKDAGGIPAHGNQRSQWVTGCHFDFPNPEYC
ncbi:MULTISPECIES: recombinase family protein [unclassified Desertifilum]|uniref:recombinase family protein n=1 Tax=unclassified Desertifilum TaxID=2621682 RepID=UPI0018EFCCD2|nr:MULTISPECIES: recombinase family protein [unclassified Desertifilum]MDA0213208.1 recombinase family protein [Cyanobacteria bacterium FC1]